MAITPQQHDAFFREVDEELRRDQFEGLFKRYGMIFAIAVAAALLAFGGYLWWQHAQAARAGSEGEALTTALADLGGPKAGPAKLALGKLADSSQPGYRAAAKLALADAALDKADVKTAAAGYKSVADDAALGAPFRDLALVRGTAVQFDTLPPAEVVARLRPLAQPGSPWFGSAGEMVAMSYLRLGKPELAGPLFAAIARDRTVPGSIRSRAVQMAAVLGVDAGSLKLGDAPGATGEE